LGDREGEEMSDLIFKTAFHLWIIWNSVIFLFFLAGLIMKGLGK
jgi:hypothetical protein